MCKFSEVFARFGWSSRPVELLCPLNLPFSLRAEKKLSALSSTVIRKVREREIRKKKYGLQVEQVDEEVRCAFAVLPHEGLESSLLWNVASATLLNLQVTKSTEQYPKVLKSTKNDSKVPEVPRSTNCSSVAS